MIKVASVDEFSLACPVPIDQYPNVLLAHGGGGKLMHQLIEKMIVPVFNNPLLNERHDGAILNVDDNKLAFTTDSYVVNPLFFPGGNIGTLAINGTVNDLAMCGANPLYLSAGFIVEEGLSMETLWTIIRSMRKAADEANVQLVTGDTKVVDRGKGDGIFINTAGIGIIKHNLLISPRNVRPGDAIILSGDLGRHGISILAMRESLSFESTIESDCAPLNKIVTALIDNSIEIRCMRDLTRGGLASALIEISEGAKLSISINEDSIPIREDVQGACEILGIDPIYLANEGRFIAFVPQADVQKALSIINSHPDGLQACVIGKVLDEARPMVWMKNKIGTNRIIEMFSGEQLPRIC
jgi:hydrogenase expression/formation protein HypE